MKKLILSLGLLLIYFSISFSQNILLNNSTEQTDYWNMAFTGGVFFNFTDNVDSDNKSHAGYTSGFELFYDMSEKKSAIVLSACYGRNNRANTVELAGNSNPYTEYYIITFGPRFYLGKKYFIETNFGNYILNYVSGRTETIGYEQNSSILKGGAFMCFGIGAGTGAIFRLSKDFSAIIKGNLNYMVPGRYLILFGGLTAGIIFNNVKLKPEIEKHYDKKGTWSVTLSGGINNPELFRSIDYQTAGHIDIEGAYRSTPKFEVYGNLEYNEIKRNPDYYTGRTIIDLNFGPRFMFGNEKYLSFFELGMGLYIQDYLNDYYSNDDVPYMGVNFGTGLIIGINEHIGIPLKGKIHLVLNGYNRPGGYLTVTGGLRYIL